MTAITGYELDKAYGDRQILAAVSLTIEDGERVGLVGVNGSGKTSLARILAGTEDADGGDVRTRRGFRLGYLAQEPVMEPTASALEVVLSGLGSWYQAATRHDAISDQIGSVQDPTLLEALLEEQAAVAAIVEQSGGWDLRYHAAATLGHLGISNASRVVGQMSGGERRRIALAQILVAEPELVILDEPTNHLDIGTIEWLERFLVNRYKGALLLITHDRYLLDRVVSRTLEVEHGALYSYAGGWSKYLEARAERAAQEARVEANRQNFLRRELEWLRRQPKARTGKQKARIGRAEAALSVEVRSAENNAALKVEATRSGKRIVEARGLAVDVAGRRLVRDLDLTLMKGQRLGIIGPNGCGKTSLLNVLLGHVPPASGTLEHGTNTTVAYLNQARDDLDGDASVYDNVAGDSPVVIVGGEPVEVRNYLYRFMFDNERQKQSVKTLSGGERARVALARVLREKANVVILDEPTNDLDVMTLSALEASLLEFGGTSVVVTHDRWFLDRIATHILSFEGDGRVVCVTGNYASYLEWRALDRKAQAAATADNEPSLVTGPPAATLKENDSPPQLKKLTYAESIELAGLMAKIEEGEAAVASLEAEISTPAFLQLDYREQNKHTKRLEEARQAAEQLVERWTELEERSEVG